VSARLDDLRIVVVDRASAGPAYSRDTPAGRPHGCPTQSRELEVPSGIGAASRGSGHEPLPSGRVLRDYGSDRRIAPSDPPAR